LISKSDPDGRLRIRNAVRKAKTRYGNNFVVLGVLQSVTDLHTEDSWMIKIDMLSRSIYICFYQEFIVLLTLSQNLPLVSLVNEWLGSIALLIDLNSRR